MDPKVTQLLEKAGAKLSVMGTEAFRILVAGTYAEGWATLAFAAFWAAGAVIFCFWSRTCLKRLLADDDTYEPDGWLTGLVVGVVGAGTAAICAAANLYAGMRAVLAPEYVALLKVLELVGK